jgi:ubiquinone/menaquinone biosynthesis C-methylase UbiE
LADAEIERVRAAYARRVHGGRYDPRRPEVVGLIASRSRAWGAALLAAGHELGMVLEVGAGDGNILRWALDAGASAAVGADVQPARLAALQASGCRVAPVLADGRKLPVRSSSVDTVVLATLLSSVLDDDVACGIAAAVDDALRPGGVVLWHDLRRRNPSNPDVRPVGSAQLAAWFPGYERRLRSTTLAPPLARRVARSTALSLLLEAVAPLRTHLAGVLMKP